MEEPEWVAVAGRAAWKAWQLNRYRPYVRLEVEDLRQEALVAAWRASETYNSSYGIELGAWMWQAAWGAVRHYIRDRAFAVRVPRVKPGEAKLLPVPVLTLDDGPPDMDSDRGKFEAAEPTQIPDPIDYAGQVVDHMSILDSLGAVPKQWLRICWMYHAWGWRQQRIAKQEGISQKHVSRILKKAAAKLRAAVEVGGEEDRHAPIGDAVRSAVCHRNGAARMRPRSRTSGPSGPAGSGRSSGNKH